jgi:hypothetical protein
MAAEDHNRDLPTRVDPVIKDCHWDNLARGLASGTISRLEAVRLLGAALLDGALASVPGLARAYTQPRLASFTVQRNFPKVRSALSV